jgi:hypothetical protein
MIGSNIFEISGIPLQFGRTPDGRLGIYCGDKKRQLTQGEMQMTAKYMKLEGFFDQFASAKEEPEQGENEWL